MQLTRIITLANKHCELQFLAMVRSLRATGCDLPVWVIPYDDNTFALPGNCTWWNIPEITSWIDSNKLWPAFRKIQCLTTGGYQFVDSDVIFLRNPIPVLESLDGFVSSCTHWSNPGHTYTSETLAFLRNKSTTWPRLVFNSGQWACDRQLFQTAGLIHFCENYYTDTLFTRNYLYKDQAGINLLVNHTGVPITNLTLPPHNMASTWAGDYLDQLSFNRFEANKKPYLMHWAGTPLVHDRYINSYFFSFLTEDEKKEFCLTVKRHKPVTSILKSKARKVYHFIRTF